MKKIVTAFGAFALAITLIGCAPGEDEGGGGNEPAAETQVTTVITLDYTSLNNLTAVGNSSYNNSVNFLLQNPWSYYDKDLNWLTNDKAVTIEKVSDEPLTIKYTIADDYNWSDGVPVTGADMVLMWAGVSTNRNDDVTEFDPDTGAGKPAADQVWFDSDDGLTKDIKEPPSINPENPKEVTVTWSKYVPDWIYTFAYAGIPAHKVGQLALGIEDATEAADAVVAAINDETKKEDLIKVANQWSRGYDFTSKPEDEGLLVVDGAYEFNEIKAGEYVSLKKRADYTAGPIPSIDNVVYRVISDPNAAQQALLNGEVDIISPDSPSVDMVQALTSAEASASIATKDFQNGIFEHVDLLFNPEAGDSPFSAAHYGGDADKAKKVRQAFLKALPRQEILDAIITPTNANAKVMNSYVVLQDDPKYADIVAGNGSDAFPGSDVEAAKALLEEAGVTTPVDVKLVYAKEKPLRVQAFQLIAEAMQPAGFNVIDSSVPGTEVGGAYGSGKYDVNMFAWQKTNTSPLDSRSTYETGGQNNFTGFSNAEADDLWSQLSEVEPEDVAKQTELVAQIEKILWD
ncbi:MAG: ABC transporter substrate-binding protein, partial [Bifidobacteriaceae bacterium]|nr:ABC transporter substrate-binding protein [Bifidobacteriaceae bacterium]